jgi:hypothetical protein
VLFSPPYPNSFDYTDIYNVELWGLGYLESNEDNRQLRDLTIRSHVQRLRSFGTRDLTSPTLQSTYDQLSDRRPELWSPHIPAMIRAYFDDLSTVLDAARSRLTRDGRIIVVVGDSRYAGITVDTAAILREMASSLALEVERCVAVRSMRASAQQGGQQLLSESLIAFAPA